MLAKTKNFDKASEAVKFLNKIRRDKDEQAFIDIKEIDGLRVYVIAWHE